MKVIFFVLIKFVIFVNSNKNNVCKNIFDYDTKYFNKNCWYDPDMDLTASEIIKRHGYPLETHVVITEDGYILQMYRIPYGKNDSPNNSSDIRQPVFFQHGLICSSAQWISFANNSHAFVLADNGYDVWVINSRGSTYSRNHTTLSVNNIKFWNFTYHEMGIYDLKASLDLVYNVTGRNDIIFIGQSMGSNIVLAYNSVLPNHAESRLKLIISMGSTIFFEKMKGIVPLLSPFWPIFYEITKIFGIGQMFSKEQFSNKLLSLVCLSFGLDVLACETFGFLATGFDYVNMLPETFPLMLGHYPQGASAKTFAHMAQNVQTKNFEYFDYGPYANKKYYNSSKPPAYNLSNVNTPVYLFYGTSDWLATKEDALKLSRKLPNVIKVHEIEDKRYNHGDYFVAKNIYDQVTKYVLEIIKNYK